jgi:hypothetical protein
MSRVRIILSCVIACMFVEIAAAFCVMPVASFNQPSDTCVSDIVYFDGRSSYDPDGTTLTYNWNFGSGATNITGATSATPSCRYYSNGSKTVTLTVTDCDSCRNCGSNKTSTPKTQTFTIVNVNKIQYFDPDTGWTDPPLLYVHLGTTVQFKAIKDPAGVSWPSGKPVWSGSSGASGSGETISVGFNMLSASISDYKTVVASCGSDVTVNVIVYEFEGVRIPYDDFTGRSQDRYGIEENVHLDCSITPSGVTASQVGGLLWSKTGVGAINNASNDGTGEYDAKELQGGAVLGLVVRSGPSKGDFKWYWPDIIKPTGTHMTRYSGNVKHIQGSASAGIALYYWLDPTDVSFRYLTFGEGSCSATGATGIYVINPPGNHPQNTFGNILGGNITTGCKVEGVDGAWTIRNPWDSGGTFTWSIPTEYIDDTSSRTSFGSNQTHKPIIQATGDTTMTKGGQSGTAALNDPNSNY